MTDPLRRRRDGFLERGAQVTRIEAFVDAAFAFAVTVMVVRVFDGVVSAAGIRAALGMLPGLVASFTVIAMFWWAHQTWSRRYGLDDGASVLLSLVLVLLIGVYVYPLQLLFQSGFAFLLRLLPGGIELPWGVEIGGYADLVFLFTVYGIAWSSLGLVVAGLYHQAWRRREEMALDLEERVGTRVQVARWLCVPATGAISIVLAHVIQPTAAWMTGLPGIVYFGMAFTGAVMAWQERRVRPAISAEMAKSPDR